MASTTASASGTCRTSTCSRADLVPDDPGQPLAIGAQAVGPGAVGVLVRDDQLWARLLEPAQVVLAHARPQVQQDRRDVIGARVQAGAREAAICSLAVADAGQDRRHQHSRPQPRLGQLRDRLSRRLGGAAPGPVERATASSSVPIEIATSTVRHGADASPADRCRARSSTTWSGSRTGCAAGQHLDAAAGQPVVALGRLVGVGVRAHRDRVAPPGGILQLTLAAARRRSP